MRLETFRRMCPVSQASQGLTTGCCCYQLGTKSLDGRSLSACIEIVVRQKWTAVGKNYHNYSRDKARLMATESCLGWLCYGR